MISDDFLWPSMIFPDMIMKETSITFSREFAGGKNKIGVLGEMITTTRITLYLLEQGSLTIRLAVIFSQGFEGGGIGMRSPEGHEGETLDC
jgi:hypothetical protein